MHHLTILSLKNRTVAVLAMLLVVAFGLVSLTQLKQELLPAMEMPQSVVLAAYPGASPDTVEREVTKPIEDALKGVKGVTKVSSTSSSSMSVTRITWESGSDSHNISNNVRSAIDKVRPNLPKDVTPQLTSGSTSDIPVAVLSISGGDGTDVGALAERLKTSLIPKLSAIPGVREVQISGVPETQVNIALDVAKLTDRGVDPSALAMLFKTETAALPGGTLTTAGKSLDVLVGHAIANLDDIKNLKLTGADGTVKLGEVATVTQDPVKSSTLERTNGKPSLVLLVMKTADGNTIQISNQVRADIKAFDPSLSSAALFDQAPYIEQSVHDLAAEGGLGLIFAIVVILLFLWAIRPTLISAISIPLSLFIALIGLWSTDNTLNLLTLGALTAAIGRVVDDSIVVIENVQRHLGLGLTGTNLIVTSVKEVAGAITSSTLTTVAVFLPLAFVGGQTGEMFRPFAITVTIALLGSLLVALTVVPVLASYFLKAKTLADGPTEATAEAETRLQRAYLPALRWALNHKVITLILATLIFFGTIFATPLLKTDFIGNAGQAMLLVEQKMPPGTALADTDKATKKIEEVLGQDAEVETFITSVGGQMNQMYANQDPSTASIQVLLKSGATAKEAAARLRTHLAAVPEIGQVDVSDGSSSANLQVLITGPTDQAIATASQEVLSRLSESKSLVNVKSNLATTKEQLAVTLKPRADEIGIGQAQLSQVVMMSTTGMPIGTALIGGKSVPAKVWLAKTSSVDELRQLKFPVTMKQTMDARKAAGEQIQAEQEAAANRAKAAAAKELAAQESQMREGRAKSAQALAALQAQLAQLLALPPGTPLPEPSARDKAIAELQGQIAGLKSAIAQSDAGMRKLADSKAAAATQEAQAKRMAQRAKEAANAKATPLELGEIAELKLVQAPTTISRQDGARTAIVSAQATGDNLSAANAAVSAAITGLKLPDGVAVKMGGVTQSQNEAFTQLGIAMLAAIAIVYAIMVATFGSLLQPLLLLVSVPFAATGALGLSIITGTPIGLPSMIGLLMLIGIVVTNAIVLIDLINQYRRRGETLMDATIHGARLRLRPIIMTALATICALLPMASGFTGGGLFISKPLAIIVIGGLLSSTVLTLILVPVLYQIVEKLRRKGDAKTKPATAQPPALPPAETPLALAGPTQVLPDPDPQSPAPAKA